MVKQIERALAVQADLADRLSAQLRRLRDLVAARR